MQRAASSALPHPSNQTFALVSVVALVLFSTAVPSQAQPSQLVQIIGEFGQVYREGDYRYPQPDGGFCDESRQQSCPNDPTQLPGKLNMPQAVAVGPDGQILVADTFNHRVQIFDAAGNHVRTIGGLGSRGLPICDWPWDPYGCVILIDGYPGQDPTTGDPRFFFPSGVAVDANGKIAVADNWNHRVLIYNPDGSLVTSLGDYGQPTAPDALNSNLGVFFFAYTVALRPGTRLGDPSDVEGRLYVLDQENQRVQVFSSMLLPLFAFGGGGNGTDAGKFHWPTGVTPDPVRGQVFVADAYNHRVQVFAEDGTFRFMFGASDVDPATGTHTNVFVRPGYTIPGGLVAPYAVAIDDYGRIYVSDKKDRVRVYRQTGPTTVEHLFDFGGSGSAPAELCDAYGLAYGGYKRIFVADTCNNRIQVFEVPGADDVAPESSVLFALEPNAAGWVHGSQTVTFNASDVGDGVARIVVDFSSPDHDSIELAPGASLVFPDGVSTLQYFAVDLAGNQEAPHSLTVSVDTAAPVVACAPSIRVITAPNHKLLPIATRVTVSDAASGTTGFTLISATSTEPDNGQGDGDTAFDLQGWAIGTPDTNGYVRAERAARGTGRTYSFTYQAADLAGNVAQCVATVDVVSPSRRR